MPKQQVNKECRDQERDPVLSMLGVGKQLWTTETGDDFVERLRAESGHSFYSNV